MINLLPPDHAMRIKFGRSNSVLRKWIFGTALAVGGLLVILAGGWVYLNSQASKLQSQLNQSKAQLQAQNLPKVQKDATEITGDIKVINQVLSSEVRFSDLIQDIGTIMPSGTILESLSLSKINGPLDLTVKTTNYASASQVAANLNDPANGLFTKVDIVSVSCSSTEPSIYKCTGELRALFGSSAIKKYQNVPKAS